MKKLWPILLLPGGVIIAVLLFLWLKNRSAKSPGQTAPFIVTDGGGGGGNNSGFGGFLSALLGHGGGGGGGGAGLGGASASASLNLNALLDSAIGGIKSLASTVSGWFQPSALSQVESEAAAVSPPSFSASAIPGYSPQTDFSGAPLDWQNTLDTGAAAFNNVPLTPVSTDFASTTVTAGGDGLGDSAGSGDWGSYYDGSAAFGNFGTDGSISDFTTSSVGTFDGADYSGGDYSSGGDFGGFA